MRRFRRLRGSEAMRRLVRETRISAEEMIYPIFVIEGENIKNPIPSMPGVFQYSVDRMDEMLAEVAASGISGVLIFGIPKEKDAVGSQAYAPDGITQRAIRHIKKKYPSLLVVADVCLCEYTSHGHCGLVEGEHILNDETLPLLAKMSVTLAQAGADIIAPSDMMDGRVARVGNMSSTFGALYDSVLDRYSEMVTLFGIFYYLILQGYLWGSMITFVALVGSLMVSYVRARAEGLGLECKVGFMQRPERVVLTSLGALCCGIFGDCKAFDPMLILIVPMAVIAVLANLTAFARIAHCYKLLKKQ